MAVEKWVGLASLGLYIMFVAEILTILIYLVNPTHEIQPGGKILQYISISVAPALVLSGTAFLMSRRFGSRIIGSMIVSGGAILLVGMYYASMLLSSIANQYLVPEVMIVPPLFMVVSIPVMITGALLFRTKPKPKKQYY